MSTTPGKVSAKALTSALKKMAAETVTQDDEGNLVTRAEQLAKLLWEKALGGKVKQRDEHGTMQDVTIKPEAWAMQYIVERMEGRAPAAIPDNEGGVRAADKVRQLAKDRINSMAVGGPPAPPRHKPKQ